MRQWIETIMRRMTARIALGLFSVLVIIHMLVMYEFERSYRRAERTAQRDAVIQKVVNVINMVNATPVTSRESALTASIDPYLSASISTLPRYNTRFKKVSLWGISHALRRKQEHFTLSIQLLPTQWLNISARVYQPFFTMHKMVFLVELLMMAALFFAAWSNNRFTKPLENFKQAVVAYSESLDKMPANIKAPTAVREVMHAVDSMQTRIKQLMHDRTQMLAAISHDLRTPITRMMLRVQLLEETPVKLKLEKELHEMTSMVNETLAFARADAQKGAHQAFDICSLLQSLCDDQQDMGSDVRFYTSGQRIALMGRPVALRRAFMNVIVNASRYASRVLVSVVKQHKQVLIKIQDNGPGIPEAHMQEVFKPFFRSDQSRSRASGGGGSRFGCHP